MADKNPNEETTEVKAPEVDGMTPAAVTVKTYDDDYTKAPGFKELQDVLLKSKPKPNDAQMDRNKKMSRIRAIGSAVDAMADIVGAYRGTPITRTSDDPFITRAMLDNRNLQAQYAKENEAWYKELSDLHKTGLSDWTKWKMEKEKLDLLKDKQDHFEEAEKGRQKRADDLLKYKYWYANNYSRLHPKSPTGSGTGTNKTKPYIDITDPEGNMIGLTEGMAHDFFNKIIDDPEIADKESLMKLIEIDSKTGAFKNTTALKSIVNKYAYKYPDLLQQAKERSRQLYPYYTIENQETKPESKQELPKDNTATIPNQGRATISRIEKKYGTATTPNHIYSGIKQAKDTNGKPLFSEEQARKAASIWARANGFENVNKKWVKKNGLQ